MNTITSTAVLAFLLLAVAVTAVRPNLVVHRDTFAYGDNELDQLDIGGPPTDHAKIARDIVHKAEWTAFGTNSAKELPGFPMVNIISVSDSKRGAPSTGNIYFLLTNLDFTGQDLMRDNRLALLFTQEQSQECSRKNVDPMEPTCARIMISGKAIVLQNSTADYQFGYEAFIDRHPSAESWVREHSFYLCKVDIAKIIVLDWYGGPHHVSTEDYFNHKYDVPEVSDSVSVGGGLKFPSSSSSSTPVQVSSDRRSGSRRDRRIRIHVNEADNDVLIDL